MRNKSDSTIIRIIFILLILKLFFAYLNVEIGWWQRHLTPNAIKFNPIGIPKEITRWLEFLLIPIMGVFLVINGRYLGGLRFSLRILGIMLVLNIFTSIVTGVNLIDSIEYTLKLGAPVLFFMCLIAYNNKHGLNIKKLMKQLVVICFGLTLIGILIFDPSFNHYRNWLPVYFASLHTHNYLLVALFIAIAYYMYTQGKQLSLLLFFIVSFLFLYKGYQIRSALVFYAVYIVAALFVMHKDFQKLISKAILLLPFGVILFFTLSANFDLNKYSSGRVTMYEEKYQMLQEYDAIDYLFGKGRGADFITTSDWWYEEKNSHNDLLTFLVENGVPYALLFLLLLLSIVFNTGKLRLLFAALVFGYLCTSLLSNGIALRTTAGYVIFITLAFIQIYKKPARVEVITNNPGNDQDAA